ncbi:hypothetical protein PLEOSDRAFT_1103675 [Pleurotus ostreatus PC15]|uniref:G domain-containing protein n=1 Tax=Pleurotus ostreatus (strain PC15) TaxID=1137138 RepID=A0A067NNY9_PLEO1|nr:hypothetical protein PLEOSDRAFT_1103675 [Pleurotus ostreatus PC15]
MPTVACIDVKDLKPSDIIIVLLGLTGSGKSTFINTATRHNNRHVGHNLDPCTRQLEVVRYRDDKEDIVFIDTPDIDGLGFTAAWWEKVTRNIVLTGIIYAHRITDNRRVSVARNLKLCKVLHTKGTVRHVTFITTMWTEVEEGEGKRREDHLLEDFWTPTFRLKSGLMRFENTVESAWNIIRVVTTEARGRLSRERVDNRLLDSIRLTQLGQIVFEEHLRLCQELSRITRELRREVSSAEGDATLKKELDRIEDLINKSMMQTQGIKIPISRRLKHFLLLKIPMKMGLIPIRTQPVFKLEQATLSRSTVHISNTPITMTDASVITGSIDLSSSNRLNSASLSSEAETFYSLFTWSNYSEGSASMPERGGHPFVASASHERPRRNSFDSSIVPVSINPLATASVVTFRSCPYSVQANISRSTDEITVTGNSSLQVGRLADQLSDCIRDLTQVITEAARFNLPRVNINEGDKYFGPIHNFGGFVGGRNNFNNLNNATNGLVELQELDKRNLRLKKATGTHSCFRWHDDIGCEV